jgi:hypothetical protein
LTGRYLVVRLRTLTGDTPVDDVLATIQEGYVPLLPPIPGLIAYLGTADAASRQSAFVGVFNDQAAAAEWRAQGAADFVEGDPIVIEGPIGVAGTSCTGGVDVPCPARQVREVIRR